MYFETCNSIRSFGKTVEFNEQVQMVHMKIVGQLKITVSTMVLRLPTNRLGSIIRVLHMKTQNFYYILRKDLHLFIKIVNFLFFVLLAVDLLVMIASPFFNDRGTRP